MWPVGAGGRDDRRAHGVRVSAVALTGSGWALGCAVTAAIVGTPYLVFGYYSPDLHLVLNTLDAAIALMVAYLVHGRFLRTQRLQDLLLAEGLALLGLAGLGVTLVLEPFAGELARTLAVWLPLTVRLVGAVLIAAAALSGRRLAQPSLQRWSRALPWLLIAAVFLVLWWQRGHLPVALDAGPPPSTQRPLIDGHPLLLLAQAASSGCFFLASLWFTYQAGRRDDELLRWLGPACALAAFARVNYVLFPSLYSDWLYTGDVLRTACYLLLLVGAAREVRQYWTNQTEIAVFEDRRRLARELHDGVIQELGYIRGASRALTVTAGAVADDIVLACDRALDEARAAVDALGRSSREPLALMLHRAARQVADRYGGSVNVEIDASITATQDQRHALVRILREAVSNATRHGGAGCVTVRLREAVGKAQLQIEDDGIGFDRAAVTSGSTGYGLTSMRERAEALPGSLDIETAPGKGTVVTVTW